MSRFDQYFLMKEADVIEYVKEKTDHFDKSADLRSYEIGDGNLNYIFRVVDEKSGKSMIVKQAGRHLRISEAMTLSLDRNRIESEILLLQSKLAPGLVPVIYDYDTVMSVCLMEDLSDYDLMRKALMQHKIFPQFADWISTFMVDSLLPTTDVIMEHKEKKMLMKQYVNPELCEISEDLVYTEPYNDLRGRNNVFAPIADFVKKELYEDAALHVEVAKLKFDFMNNAQALIHGDLHTGSIFIKPDSMKVFDPEFAFYGPMGYDIGNVVANMIFAWCNGDATIEDEAERKAYTAWVESVIRDTVDLTKAKMLKCFEAKATDHMAKAPGFREAYVASVISDTAGVTGLELNRRTVGMANVKDLTTIPDEAKRAVAEKICISAAKRYIMERERLQTGAQFLEVLKGAVHRHKS